MQPYMNGEKEPRLKNYYVLLWPGGGTLGARVVDDERIGELERIVRDEVVVGIPDTRVFVNEGELFGGIGGSARSVAIHLQSTDTAALNAAAEEGRKLLEQTFPGANVQSFPNADVQALELRAEPNDRRIAEVGWDRASLGTVVRALGDGAWLGEYFDGQTRLPVILRTNLGETPEELAQAPLITPSGEVVSLGELVTLQTTLAPEQIRRIDHHRTVTLTIDPPPTLSLEDMLAKIDSDIVPSLRAQLPPDANIRLAGSADRLDTIISTMGVNFLLALLVLFMLMAAMFHSLRDAAVVVLTVPLALAGGVLGIRAARAGGVPAARSADDDRLHHDDRHHRQSRDPAGRSHARRAQSRPQPRRGAAHGAESAPARDGREHADRRARRAADGRESRPGEHDLSRPRGGERRRRDREHGVLDRAAAEPDATGVRAQTRRPTG